MKNIIVLILTFICLHFANGQTLSTNLRVAVDNKEQLPALYLYEINVTEKIITFDCENCEMDFKLSLTDTIEVTTSKDYKIITKDTDEDDQVAIIYKHGQLTSIAIMQSNGVTLYYIQTELKAKETSYKL